WSALRQLLSQAFGLRTRFPMFRRSDSLPARVLPIMRWFLFPAPIQIFPCFRACRARFGFFGRLRLAIRQVSAHSEFGFRQMELRTTNPRQIDTSERGID